MRVLLIGASGLMGIAIEKVCNRKGIDCVGLTHEDLEITNFAAVEKAIEKNKADAVINVAVFLAINECELDPHRAFDINAIAVSNLAKICEKKRIILVQPSTHVVFDGTKVGPYTEDDTPNPSGIYSASKYAAECLTRHTCTRHYITRFPTLFGPRRLGTKGFVDKMLERIAKREEVRVADDKIDSPTYSTDAAEALISLITTEKPFGTYHVANSGVVNYYDFIAKLIEMLKIDATLTRAKDKDFPALAYKPLNTALRSIKLEPLRSWQDALSNYIAEDLK